MAIHMACGDPFQPSSDMSHRCRYLLLLLSSPLLLGALFIVLLLIESIACAGKLGQTAGRGTPAWPAKALPPARTAMNHDGT